MVAGLVGLVIDLFLLNSRRTRPAERTGYGKPAATPSMGTGPPSRKRSWSVSQRAVVWSMRKDE